MAADWVYYDIGVFEAALRRCPIEHHGVIRANEVSGSAYRTSPMSGLQTRDRGIRRLEGFLKQPIVIHGKGKARPKKFFPILVLVSWSVFQTILFQPRIPRFRSLEQVRKYIAMNGLRYA